MKYSDIMRLASGRAAYNIQQEGEGDWETFIANDTFNKILGDMTGAVAGNDVNKHKSVWIYGTYGTGKSHAGAVLKHLFCDPADEIRGYVDRELGASKFSLLRADLYKVRDRKRLFPVSLYGAQSIAHPEDLALQLQKQTAGALRKADIEVSVPTDFDTLANHVAEHQQIWQSIIDGSPALRSVAPSPAKLRQLLAASDTGVLALVREAQRQARIDVRLSGDKIYRWISEVQEELRKKGTYCGLLFVWDEFTEVATSGVGLSVLHKMQELVEALSGPENDTLFLLIAHPSALNSLNDSERKKTTDRYHYEHYNMEPVSAFKIMSRKFEVSGRDAYDAARRGFFARCGAVVDALARSSADPAATADDIRGLFPLHPSTANLATYYAREAGSSSRSVFDFLASRGVADFLEAEGNLDAGRTVTCDYLWDYVREGFEADTARFGAVVERWNSHHVNVEAQGDSYARVFKGILLLNALNNIANSDSVTPARQNIEALFVGTEVEEALPEVLDFFNDSSIIQRQPNGSFSILYTALPADEIVTLKKKMATDQFPCADRIVNYGETARTLFSKHLASVLRPLKFAFFSRQANETTFISKVENTQRHDAKGYELFVAILVGRDSAEVAELRSMAERNRAAADRFGTTIFAVMDAPFGDVEYGRFIEYMANAECARSHGLPNQVQTYEKNACEMIAEWCKKMLRQNVSFFLRGECLPTSGGQMVRKINEEIAPAIFSKGPEALETIRVGAATYWKMATVRTTVDSVLMLSTKQEVVAKCVGQAKHVDFLLQDSVDDDLRLKDGVSPSHPLRLVADYVTEMLSPRHTERNTVFNLGEKLKGLAAAPFGLFRSYAPMAMVAFAMREHVGTLYDVNGKLCDAKRMVDAVVEMFNAWDSGVTDSPRLNFSMESREAGSMRKTLVSMFSLDRQSGYSDISTLKDARWAVCNGYVAKVGVPLWALKYCAGGSVTERMRDLIDNVVKVVGAPVSESVRNPALLSAAVRGYDELRIDWGNLLAENGGGNFRAGFDNFLMSVNEVGLKENELEEANRQVARRLQGDVGSWSEDGVREALKSWRLESLMQSSAPTPHAPQPAPMRPAPAALDAPQNRDAVRNFSAWFDGATESEVKRMVGKIISAGDVSIISHLWSYVQ